MSFKDRQRRNELLYFIVLAPVIFFLPFTALLSFAIYLLVYLVSCFFPNYGKFINYFDVLLDEDFVNKVPQNSIVITLTLKGDLSLSQLKSIFTANVLNAPSKLNPKKLRYPELKQYLSNFVCFRIWKNDPSFLIHHHIKEESWNGSNLSDIHQEHQNNFYEKRRSPWELVLIRNVNFNDDTENIQKSLLVLRVHHSMADAKSLLKLVIECLGNKPLKTASAQVSVQETISDKLRFILYFPLNGIIALYTLGTLLFSSFNHPWKLNSSSRRFDYETDKIVIAFSPKIYMSHVKLAAKQNGVKTSSVVMSIIAGAIRKFSGDKWNKKVTIGYVLPRANHPDYLTNHLYFGIMGLPTDEQCAFERLQQCNQEFLKVRDNQQARYVNVGSMLSGIQTYPMNRLIVNALAPACITNIAGDEEGFSVGNAECIDFRMSVGTCRGVMGVFFCCISYQDGMRIGVGAKESVLSKGMASDLAKYIEYELQLLIEGS